MGVNWRGGTTSSPPPTNHSPALRWRTRNVGGFDLWMDLVKGLESKELVSIDIRWGSHFLVLLQFLPVIRRIWVQESFIPVSTLAAVSILRSSWNGDGAEYWGHWDLEDITRTTIPLFLLRPFGPAMSFLLEWIPLMKQSDSTAQRQRHSQR